MNKRDKIQVQKIQALEAEFQELLLPCLEQCARGRWGLFGAYDQFPEVRVHINWPEVDRLRELAIAIRSIRAESGERYELSEQFLELCTFNRANDPGEPKLALAFLDRIRDRQ